MPTAGISTPCVVVLQMELQYASISGTHDTCCISDNNGNCYRNIAIFTVYMYNHTLQKQKGCFNQLGLSQLHLHYQAMCIQSDQLTYIQVSNLDSTLARLFTSSVLYGHHVGLQFQGNSISRFLCDSCTFPGAIDLLQMQLHFQHCSSYVATCNYYVRNLA